MLRAVATQPLLNLPFLVLFIHHSLAFLLPLQTFLLGFLYILLFNQLLVWVYLRSASLSHFYLYMLSLDNLIYVYGFKHFHSEMPPICISSVSFDFCSILKQSPAIQIILLEFFTDTSIANLKKNPNDRMKYIRSILMTIGVSKAFLKSQHT